MMQILQLMLKVDLSGALVQVLSVIRFEKIRLFDTKPYIEDLFLLELTKALLVTKSFILHAFHKTFATT